MIIIRKADERGHFDHGWLDTYHTFSFADYYDPQHMGFRALRVINEDRVQPGRGFGTHAHRDMEIITWVLEGALEHKDSMGNGSTITPGEVQRMTAGTGVTHSEFNHSRSDIVHLLQIWILPDRHGLNPSYEQKRFPDEEAHNRLRIIAAPDGRDGAVTVHQDVEIFLGRFTAGREISYPLSAGRNAWLQVARGAVDLQRRALASGDGAAVSDERSLDMTARADAEILLFDLA